MGLIPGQVKPKTIKKKIAVFFYEARFSIKGLAHTDWFGIGITFQSRATCLFVDYCFSELVLKLWSVIYSCSLNLARHHEYSVNSNRNIRSLRFDCILLLTMGTWWLLNECPKPSSHSINPN